jgi:hypothetical protein
MRSHRAAGDAFAGAEKSAPLYLAALVARAANGPQLLSHGLRVRSWGFPCHGYDLIRLLSVTYSTHLPSLRCAALHRAWPCPLSSEIR